MLLERFAGGKTPQLSVLKHNAASGDMNSEFLSYTCGQTVLFVNLRNGNDIINGTLKKNLLLGFHSQMVVARPLSSLIQVGCSDFSLRTSTVYRLGNG